MSSPFREPAPRDGGITADAERAEVDQAAARMVPARISTRVLLFLYGFTPLLAALHLDAVHGRPPQALWRLRGQTPGTTPMLCLLLLPVVLSLLLPPLYDRWQRRRALQDQIRIDGLLSLDTGAPSMHARVSVDAPTAAGDGLDTEEAHDTEPDCSRRLDDDDARPNDRRLGI
jgi:hypothetical protein